MNGNELLWKLKRYAKANDLIVRLVERHGKGSHALLYLGTRCTVAKDRKKEIGAGLLARTLRDLGLTLADLG